MVDEWVDEAENADAGNFSKDKNKRERNNGLHIFQDRPSNLKHIQ